MTQTILIKSAAIRIAPSKFKRILKQICGKKYSEALEFLKYIPQKCGVQIWKLLKSVAANAVHNYKLNKDYLVISEAFVTKASILKRMRPRAKGKAFKIEKRSSYITLCLQEHKIVLNNSNL